MTLTEVRKKYLGKTVNVQGLDADEYRIYTDEKGKHLVIDSGSVYVYHAKADLDDENRITRISRMTLQELMGDDATHVNYANRRVRANDYDELDDLLAQCVKAI